jgi:hypothetical protein
MMNSIYSKFDPNMAFSLAILGSSLGGEISALSNVYLVSDDVCIPDQCEVCSTTGAYLSGSYLYWRASEEGIGSCGPLKTQEVNGTVIASLISKADDPNFRWGGGYRITAGYDLSETWGIAAFWTHYKNHDNKHHIQNSRLNWKLDYDTIDLALGYNWAATCSFNLKPFFGLRGAQIDQKILLCSNHGTLTRFNSTERDHKQHFNGLGPLLGIKANWGMSNGFSFFAAVAYSVLYGKHHVKLQNIKQFKEGYSVSCGKRRHDVSTAVTDLAFGFQYEKCCFDKSRLILSLAVEHHQYYNYNRMGNSHGDLCLDGVTLTAGLTF